MFEGTLAPLPLELVLCCFRGPALLGRLGAAASEGLASSPSVLTADLGCSSLIPPSLCLVPSRPGPPNTPRCCQAVITLLPCYCRAVATLLPCNCHAVAMVLPCIRHAVAMPLPRGCSNVAMRAPCNCHAFAMLQPCDCLTYVAQWPCACHADALLLPCCQSAVSLHMPRCCHAGTAQVTREGRDRATLLPVFAVPMPCISHAVEVAAGWRVVQGLRGSKSVDILISFREAAKPA